MKELSKEKQLQIEAQKYFDIAMDIYSENLLLKAERSKFIAEIIELREKVAELKK